MKQEELAMHSQVTCDAYPGLKLTVEAFSDNFVRCFALNKFGFNDYYSIPIEKLKNVIS